MHELLVLAVDRASERADAVTTATATATREGIFIAGGTVLSPGNTTESVGCTQPAKRIDL